MSSCLSSPLTTRDEKFADIRAIRTENAAKEIEQHLWNGVVAESLLPDDLGGVIDMTFRVDRKSLVLQALRNIIARIEELP